MWSVVGFLKFIGESWFMSWNVFFSGRRQMEEKGSNAKTKQQERKKKAD